MAIFAYNARPLLLAQTCVWIWGQLAMPKGFKAALLDTRHLIIEGWGISWWGMTAVAITLFRR